MKTKNSMLYSSTSVRNQKQKRNNLLLFLCQTSFVSASAAFVSSSFLSAFFLGAGMTERQISFYLSAVGIVDTAASVLFSGIAERLSDLLRAYSVFSAILTLLNVLYLVFCLPQIPLGLFIFGVYGIGFLISAVTAVRTTVGYQVPCLIFDRGDYPVMQSASGVIGGGFGILIGLLVSYLFSRFPEGSVTASVFLAGGLCRLISAVLCFCLTEVSEPEAEKQSSARVSLWKTVSEVASDPDFRRMLLPNLLRGFGSAAIGVVPLLASAKLSMNASELTRITVFSSASTLLGCSLYGVLSKRFGVPRCCFAGALLFCLLIPAYSGSVRMFYILYFAANMIV